MHKYIVHEPKRNIKTINLRSHDKKNIWVGDFVQSRKKILPVGIYFIESGRKLRQTEQILNISGGLTIPFLNES